MKSHGIFSRLCQNIDCMEQEMGCLCSLLGKFCGKGRKETCDCHHPSPCKKPDCCDFRCEKCEKND